MAGHDEDQPGRLYEKGRDRHKHVGESDKPTIVFVNGHPRYRRGLCPSGVPDDLKVRLLSEAISEGNGDRDMPFPKRLHVVHGGAIYRAETTDWGRSYHAYPYAGKLGKSLLEKLGRMADNKRCRKEFDTWVKLHIEQHGK